MAIGFMSAEVEHNDVHVCAALAYLGAVKQITELLFNQSTLPAE
jgi:hypothetical protein